MELDPQFQTGIKGYCELVSTLIFQWRHK